MVTFTVLLTPALASLNDLVNDYYSVANGPQLATQCPMSMSDAGDAAAWACLDSEGTSVCYMALVENLRADDPGSIPI